LQKFKTVLARTKSGQLWSNGVGQTTMREVSFNKSGRRVATVMRELSVRIERQYISREVEVITVE